MLTVPAPERSTIVSELAPSHLQPKRTVVLIGRVVELPTVLIEFVADALGIATPSLSTDMVTLPTAVGVAVTLTSIV